MIVRAKERFDLHPDRLTSYGLRWLAPTLPF